MIPTPPYDENDLFPRIAQGDEQAFRKLFDGYRERLYAFAWQLCHSAVDAEEVVQDIFLKLWEQRERLADVSSPGSYIYAMTRNRTLDLLTKIARNEQMIRQVWNNMKRSENEAEELLHAQESRKLIEAALSQLSEKKQTVFRLSRQEGLSHQEIASRMNLSVQTVKNIITEVLRHIQHFLSQHSEILSIIFWLQTASLLL
ncbi:MAG: RNA polymerase sigma-70 factor [Bacteroidetes bacterium]|nr:RNA polymerase sigma-70 factor [Bacteroidota bacterium]